MKKIKLQERRKGNPTTLLNEEEEQQFVDFWQQIYTDDRPPTLHQTTETSSEPPSIEEIRTTIQGLAKDKAPGPDDI